MGSKQQSQRQDKIFCGASGAAGACDEALAGPEASRSDGTCHSRYVEGKRLEAAVAFHVLWTIFGALADVMRSATSAAGRGRPQQANRR
jgi:hypothetical protein